MSNPIQDRHLEALVSSGTVRAFPGKTVLIKEGEQSDRLYVVITGKLKVYITDADGQEVVIDTLGPKQFFGERALEGRPRAASVMTLEPCRLSVVEPEQFKRFLAVHPEAAYALIVALIRRASNLARVIGSLGLLDIYGRVARLLLDEAVEDDGDKVILGIPDPQGIAKRVNATPETVSRIMTDLRDGGYIEMEDNRIVILRDIPSRW